RCDSSRVLIHRLNWDREMGRRSVKKAGNQRIALRSPRMATKGRRFQKRTFAIDRAKKSGYQTKTSGSGALSTIAPEVITMSAKWYLFPGSDCLPHITCS